MSKPRRVLATSVVTFSTVAFILGSMTLFAPAAQAKKRCGICPLFCLEVICDDGNVYCNSCLAGCAGAHNCHPF